MRRINKLLALLSLLWLYQLSLLVGETYTPEIYGEQRYQRLWSRKPFHSPTPIAPLPQTEEQPYVLSALLKIGNQWIAFVQNCKSLERHSVFSVPNEMGLQLISVNEDAWPLTAVLLAGGQLSTMRFDPTVFKSAIDASKIVVQNSPVTESPPVVPPTPETPPSAAIKTIYSSIINQ